MDIDRWKIETRKSIYISIYIFRGARSSVCKSDARAVERVRFVSFFFFFYPESDNYRASS